MQRLSPADDRHTADAAREVHAHIMVTWAHVSTGRSGQVGSSGGAGTTAVDTQMMKPMMQDAAVEAAQSYRQCSKAQGMERAAGMSRR